VGQALRELAPRDKWVIATKYSPRPAAQVDPAVSGAEWIRTCIDNSLRRLGVDTIDLYYMHSWDYMTPIEESLEALNEAVVAGKVRALGVSNCHPYQLARANDIAAAHGWARFEAIQSHMNLIFREDERELLQLCAEDGISTMPYSALAAGRLSRKPGETSKRLEMDTFAKGKYDATAEQDNVIVERVAEVAERMGTSMTAVSLAWLLTKVTSPVVGATKPHHLEGPAAAADLVLSRAGASSIAEIAALAVPSMLVPYPFATADHQTTNARYLVDAGAAVMLADDAIDTPAFAQELLSLVDDAARRDEMRERARGLAQDQAASVLADQVEAAAQGR
jgi:aryl-alcohol dehydrogenase-like predicted oxidoreductase